ncbi:MAG: PucR family transcriptional regulator, partial [Oscillospiraceae bacterium]|nr:PucR family transcriptional regulator [Oscillospiraceae bacterium]
MSNRLFQGIIHQMREAIGRTVGVVDETGTIISCSELGRIGEVCAFPLDEHLIKGETFCMDGQTFRPFGSVLHPEYAAFVDGDDELSPKYAEIVAVSLGSVKSLYDEKYDRGNFIKNVVLDNILPGDIYLKARELRFTTDTSRVVLLIRIPEHNDISIYDIIQNLFPDKTKDFVININETDIALVKEVRANIETRDLEKLARS